MKGTFKKAFALLQKAKELYDEADDVKSKAETIKKMANADAKEREKLVREVAGASTFFDAPLAAAQKVRDDLTAVANDKTEFPGDSETAGLFAAAAAATKKHGEKSKEAKAAWGTYAKALAAFGAEMDKELAHLDQMKAQLGKRAKAAVKLEELSRTAWTLLEKALKVPWPPAVQAGLFTASEDVGQLLAQAGNIVTLLKTIEKNVDANIKDGEDLIANNLKWTSWAAKAADLPLDQLLKNAKAKTPK